MCTLENLARFALFAHSLVGIYFNIIGRGKGGKEKGKGQDIGQVPSFVG